jgi:hypothetical protein
MRKGTRLIAFMVASALFEVSLVQMRRQMLFSILTHERHQRVVMTLSVNEWMGALTSSLSSCDSVSDIYDREH